MDPHTHLRLFPKRQGLASVVCCCCCLLFVVCETKMAELLIEWLSGPPLVEGISPVPDHETCQGWDCADFTRVFLASVIGHS